MWSSTFTLLTLLGSTLALPQPKISSIRRPGWRPNRRDLHTDSTDTSSSPPTTTAPKDNIWNVLSNDEAADVISFLHSKDDLNLTSVDDAGSWDNTIMVIDLLAPNKTDALDYLDKNGTMPERWAIASLLFGATEEPYAQDWVVGPIPITNDSSYYPYTFGTHTPEAKIRVYDMDSHS
ncbi:uncharacterized protein IL334_005599 [Kwoniella shivajii]|uniref:Copper amine oxidase N2-terminal domain-containing protein n=1 Tax=Kwoniella shivajii TaxID=564305 RepID=A0ABZ1D3K5_9TREE|nr:hypothetical protein IL334_005599 [Kwoniella shivajii]